MEVFDTIDFSLGADGYRNVMASEVNDHVVRVSVMTEAYFWHYHPGSDETFICLEGVLLIDMPNKMVRLQPGQLFTVLAGQHHCTRPEGGRSVNITIERRDIQTVKIF
ncbi:cupin domain-containing protein [Pedobacter sp. Du54]|uniref:cupin domain-containing protein n=1 Tax=Pedobacter anseongensis TaxID=3133439 RepID=UPI0030AD15C3